ncbi:expansin family protein [Mycena amicta]|nr:expansin family protein [Mycena amicta]
MYRLVLLAVFSLGLVSATAVPPSNRSTRAIAKSKYTTAHSLADSYSFDPRDGWQSFNATNLQYKYRRSKQTAPKSDNALSALFRGLFGIGSPNKAIVTWYTGHDLLNPSCWANTKWHPTDESFVCATTMVGWTTRPKCFQFVEICNEHKTCTFCRVVDTCAGCREGSSHLDLTRAAFGHLAAFDQGLLNVQMRIASKPSNWSVCARHSIFRSLT